MCKTKAEGGRCAAHLRKAIDTARNQATAATKAAVQAAKTSEANPDDKDAARAKQQARSEWKAAQQKVTDLQGEYDSTRTGQRELKEQSERLEQSGADPQTLQPLKTRLNAGKLRREGYQQAAAHKEVADKLRDRDVQHDAISHDETGTTITLPSDPGRSHEVSIQADPARPPASRYSVTVTTAVEERDTGAWDDEDVTPPEMQGRWSQQDATDWAADYSRWHMPRQTEADQAETSKALSMEGIPAERVHRREGGSTRVSLPEKEPYYKRNIVISPHRGEEGTNGPSVYTATYTESLRDEDGEEVTTRMEPIPHAGERKDASGFRTAEEAARDVSVFTQKEDGFEPNGQDNPWGLRARTREGQPQYDPAPF